MQNVIAEVSLKTIAKNAETVVLAAGKPLIAVGKVGAYGHGAEEVASSLRGISSFLAASTAAQGAVLCVSGIGEDFFVPPPAIT